MKIRSLMAALTLAVGTLGIATVASAARVVDVEIGVAPPAPRGADHRGDPALSGRDSSMSPATTAGTASGTSGSSSNTSPIAKGITGGTTRWSSTATGGIIAPDTGTTTTDA